MVISIFIFFFLPLCLIICTAFSLLLAPNLYNCPGLDGPAEADAGGGHCGQEGAGTRTISQVSLLLQTDQYACPDNKDYFLNDHIELWKRNWENEAKRKKCMNVEMVKTSQKKLTLNIKKLLMCLKQWRASVFQWKITKLELFCHGSSQEQSAPAGSVTLVLYLLRFCRQICEQWASQCRWEG